MGIGANDTDVALGCCQGNPPCSAVPLLSPGESLDHGLRMDYSGLVQEQTLQQERVHRGIAVGTAIFDDHQR